jgi:hypothetical protein
MTVAWLVAALIAFTLLGDGDPVAGVQDLLRGITRGARLTHAVCGKDGVVDFDPGILAHQAGATLEAYALARMISSEEGNADPITKAAIALVAVNYAARVDRDVASLLLRAKNPAHTGYFGTQRDIDEGSANFNGSDRYASTALDPYAGDLQIAEGVLDGTIEDFTGGAIQFDRINAFKTPADAARTAQNRIAEGRTQVAVAGADPKLRFWA